MPPLGLPLLAARPSLTGACCSALAPLGEPRSTLLTPQTLSPAMSRTHRCSRCISISDVPTDTFSPGSSRAQGLASCCIEAGALVFFNPIPPAVPNPKPPSTWLRSTRAWFMPQAGQNSAHWLPRMCTEFATWAAKPDGRPLQKAAFNIWPAGFHKLQIAAAVPPDARSFFRPCGLFDLLGFGRPALVRRGGARDKKQPCAACLAGPWGIGWNVRSATQLPSHAKQLCRRRQHALRGSAHREFCIRCRCWCALTSEPQAGFPDRVVRLRPQDKRGMFVPLVCSGSRIGAVMAHHRTANSTR